ncbi:pimeloyl-ACP methyl ester carboxylesterase [Nakamurella sp. UYEF19]|uniref:alpha/beta fold hydrolase n=1 Tax=Nakamurella sp. UYEF19 TaxID=1756392 RepID=UPI003399A778
MFDDEETLLADVEHPAHGAIRVPDGRALAWSEYGSARGVPCILIPDAGSSRLAPAWLLHDSALPSAVRLLALDRPGTGASDPIGLGGREDPAEDLRRLVDTLAVGRVAVIGIGQGVDDVFAFATRYPRLVASVSGVSARLSEPAPARRSILRPFADRAQRPVGGLLGSWLAATAPAADLTRESTWAKALPRMTAAAAAALGDRWQETDFRAALATDAEQTQKAWGTVTRPAEPGGWSRDLTTDGVPVHLWHGQNEGTTSVSEIRSLVGARPGWEVTGVTGPTAVLGVWPQILSSAASSFTNNASAA